MNDWFTLHTLIAFILGVLLSAWAKSLVGKARGAAGV
jgi:hypothetical protein